MAEPKVTTEVLWRGTIFFASIDIFFVYFLAKKINKDQFRGLKWALASTTSIFWFLIWIIIGSYLYWDSVYHYVFPEWARWIIPPVYGIMFGAVGLLFWWLALRIRGNVVINFCILGGLLGMITHIWAISRGILDKPPMLEGASPIAASILPIFEFIFYWCIILSLTLFISSKLLKVNKDK